MPFRPLKQMVALSNEAKKEGLLSLENRAGEIEAMEARHETNAGIFTSAGTYAPTLGVLGAVFGLIAAMANIDDTGAVAEAIAAAFIATILGIFTGYVLWHPFAKKLKIKSQEEVLLKSMVIEGLLSIQKGDSPLMVQEKLLSTLPESKQNEVLESLKQY